jgi:hypothetical protein
MDDEIARLRQALAEEQRRREEAEEVARASQPQTIEHYLEACHSLSQAIEVVTDRSLTTQGDTTNPVSRIYPQRIIPWHDFPAQQEEIWNQLSESPFALQATFPSQHQLDYVRSVISPISSEHGLRHFERDTVENAVQKLVDAIYADPALRVSLGLRDNVTFESHTNLGITNDDISEPLERMSLTDGALEGPTLAPTAAARKSRPTKGKGNRADQFCIYRTSDGANVPITAIEYKPPHKLSQDEVVTGLVSEIQPDRDVINKDGEGFVFASKALATAVVTQLFSYMVGKSLQFGYVCTGQTLVFLYISDDPATVYYYVCVPNLDVLDDDENRLHRTAVAQILAFILRALRISPPPQAWHDAAERLKIWAVEFEDVLSKIPISIRKDKTHASPYKPQRWRGFTRSPIRTRSRCRQLSTAPGLRGGDDDDEENSPPSPTRDRSTRSGKTAALSNTDSGRGRGKQDSERRQQGKRAQSSIQERPYCTHGCLLGLTYGGLMDNACPNTLNHGSEHIGRTEFLRLLRVQLAQDRGPDADSIPLYLSGAVGSLFKVRLSAHGYTLIAKGVEAKDLGRLQHEKKVYDQLSTIQGKHVPVCLGLINLDLPYYYDGGVFEHFLLLSWAGRPLRKCIHEMDKTLVIDAVTKAYTSLHQLKVRHGDAEVRNILYDRDVMVVDFERAELYRRQPLGPISPNQNRKRERGHDEQAVDVDFVRELGFARENVSTCLASLPRRV